MAFKSKPWLARVRIARSFSMKPPSFQRISPPRPVTHRPVMRSGLTFPLTSRRPPDRKSATMAWTGLKCRDTGSMISYSGRKAYARGSENRILIWIHDDPHQFSQIERYTQYDPIQPVTLTLPEIQDGRYDVEQYDPYTGEITTKDSRIRRRGWAPV